MDISYPLIRMRKRTYQGVRNVRFRKVCRALFSCNTRFEIRPFALFPTNYNLLLLISSMKKIHYSVVFKEIKHDVI